MNDMTPPVMLDDEVFVDAMYAARRVLLKGGYVTMEDAEGNAFVCHNGETLKRIIHSPYLADLRRKTILYRPYRGLPFKQPPRHLQMQWSHDRMESMSCDTTHPENVMEA